MEVDGVHYHNITHNGFPPKGCLVVEVPFVSNFSKVGDDSKVAEILVYIQAHILNS